MIKQIIKIIWNERSSNAWLFFELVLIFSIMWFCVNFLWSIGSKYIENEGFDITHVYNVSLGAYPASITGEVSAEDRYQAVMTIVERLKQHTAIESVSISQAASPYNGSYRSTVFKINSTDLGGIQAKIVSPEFFDVYKINLLSGRNFDENDMIGNNHVIIGVDKDNKFKDFPVEVIDSISDELSTFVVVGVSSPSKRADFEDYKPIVYFPMTKEVIAGRGQYIDISFRVESDADHADFAQAFTDEMRAQMNISPYFLANITPASDAKIIYMKWGGIENALKSVFAISAFILLNVFLGTIGTFWLRTQSRSKEIGLQMALGASKKRIKIQYITEALILLVFVSIVGCIVTVNILATGLLDNVAIPFIEGQTLEAITIDKLLINYLLTTCTLAVIITIAIWYPVKNATKIKPAVVLKEE